MIDIWVRDGSPDALAFDYLESLDLGADFGHAKGVGEIRLHDGVSPGNDSKIVTAPDQLSLSLLQKRLNDLGEYVLVKVSS